MHLAEPTNGILAAGEGIETCLSFQQSTGIPVWAGMTDGGVRDFVLPKGVHQLYILADVDEETNVRGVMRRAGQEAARRTAQRIANMGIAVSIVWPGDPKGPKVDFNDLLNADPSGQSIRDSLARAEQVHPHGKPVQPTGNEWLNLLRVGMTGVLPNLSNTATVLENHPAFNGMLAFNDFRQSFILIKRPPWDNSTDEFKSRDMDDNDITSLTRWMQGPTLGQHAMARLGIETARQAAENVGYKVHIHPVRDWVGSLKWDKSPRLSTWLRDFMGVNDTEYSRAVARAWMISAIARIYQPGCKADGVLVLIGDQGAKKSQAISIIGGEWFRDTVFDLTNKDAFVQLRGAWIYELAELSALAKAEVERVKAFMSSQKDVFRPPFGRTIVEVPRQLVFVATTNKFEFLKDQTGNRRFWPVEVTKVEIKALEYAREQLIAEAVAAYHSGEDWWLSVSAESTAKMIQKEHLSVDPWETKIYAIIDGRDNCTVSEILYSIEPDCAKWQPGWDTRVGTILSNLGWGKIRKPDGKGGRERRYVRNLQVSSNEVQPCPGTTGQPWPTLSGDNSEGWPEKTDDKQGVGQPGQPWPGFFPIESKNEPFMRAGVAHVGAHDTYTHAHSKTGVYRKEVGQVGQVGHEEANDSDNVVPIRPPRRPL
ncbi:MAG: toprim domain-containing protein [Magnetococcus sp. YQC-5]